ncbi:hypothetical protein [Bradyrhizobium sp. Leo121]|uniref:hypothetical protein n=1 Tax=Bradyrhizobium sp. Leo121 TaxID=1571195 RepID=UPI001028BE46|nr:hypothetical protein [Bradyrhizobium sp. Leo121]RZN19506.1 hypothetical protein CWO90_35335 [Bradyrhizobium sp. Leo121]
MKDATEHTGAVKQSSPIEVGAESRELEYEWVEPFGEGPEPVHCRMSSRDIIAAQKRRPEYANATDQQALDDFIVVNWARLSSRSPLVGREDIWGLVSSSIKEQLAEGDGMWVTCSGCHEGEDGYSSGHYPHSEVFGCKLGAGCRECGGIGAIWDTTDYADMARFVLSEEATLGHTDGGAVALDRAQDAPSSIVMDALVSVGNQDAFLDMPRYTRDLVDRAIEELAGVAEQSGAGAPETSVRCGAPAAHPAPASLSVADGEGPEACDPAQEPTKRAGPRGWPYSMAQAKANNVIWRLTDASPQSIYDALDAEGLEIVEKSATRSAPTSPAPDTAALRGALEECVSVLAMVERPARVDPDHGDEVAALGDRIGYGALMTSASASWRARLGEDGDPVGGEFVAGPCHVTVLRALKKARTALSHALPHQEEGKAAVALEPYIAAALRHADGLSAQLDKPEWRPGRAHVEQARNTIRNLAEKVRALTSSTEADHG